MEEPPKYIIQKDGHIYSFFDYRRVFFGKFEDIILVNMFVQFKKGHAFKRIELILRTIEKTNVDEINGKLQETPKTKK